MPAFIGVQTATGTTSCVVNKPTGVVSGDLMIASILTNDASNPSPPSGWTQLTSLFGHRVYYKVATGSEPSTYTFTSSSSGMSGIIAAYSDAGVPEVSGTANAVSATATAPSITTISADNIVVAIGTNVGNASISTPASTTFRASVNGNFSDQRLVDYAKASAGSTGTKDFTLGSSVSWRAAHLSIPVGNTAPNAPILTSPVGGTVVDRTAIIPLQGTFSDPDAGDQLSEVTVQHRPVAGSSTTVVQAASGSTFTVNLSAGALSAGNYEWRAKTKDAAGVEGAYSAWAPFTAAAPPADPVLTEPAVAATVATNPSLTEWTAPSQDAFQVQTRSASGGGGTLYHDSGTVVSATRSYSTPRPTQRTEWTRVRVRSSGLWSAWVERSNTVAYTPPAEPTAVVDTHASGVALVVGATHPTPTGSEPTVTSHDVLRRESTDGGTTWSDAIRVAAAVDPAEDYTDWLVAPRTDYQYAIRATGDNTTETTGDWA